MVMVTTVTMIATLAVTYYTFAVEDAMVSTVCV